MLMDSMSDPRRANWLAISGMAEDLCWPEEGSGTSRPSWELEAEILRLTTRLMIRERELKQAKGQIKNQATKAQQQMADLRWRMVEKEDEMRLLLLQKDSEMQTIVSQLLLFESELRQEQNRIESLLTEKDDMIQRQQKEIQKLRDLLDNRDALSNLSEVARSRLSRDSVVSCDFTNFTNKEYYFNGSVDMKSSKDDSAVAVKKLRDGIARIRAIQDLTNVKSTCSSRSDKFGILFDATACENTVISDRKRASYKAPQKMKDLKAKRMSAQKSHRQQVATNDLCSQVLL